MIDLHHVWMCVSVVSLGVVRVVLHRVSQIHMQYTPHCLRSPNDVLSDHSSSNSTSHVGRLSLRR